MPQVPLDVTNRSFNGLLSHANGPVAAVVLAVPTVTRTRTAEGPPVRAVRIVRGLPTRPVAVAEG